MHDASPPAAAAGRSRPDVGEAVRLLGLLADPLRLRVLAGVLSGGADVKGLAESLGADNRTVALAVRRLATAGLLEGGRAPLRARLQALSAAARRLALAGATDEAIGDPVTRPFFREGRLVSVPAGRAKRRAVLDRLAATFEPGVRYPEREVNQRLRVFYPDHALLRRYLVDEGFLSREAGFYWRTGGTVDVDASSRR